MAINGQSLRRSLKEGNDLFNEEQTHLSKIISIHVLESVFES